MRFCPSCLSLFSADLISCSLDGTRLESPSEDPLVGREIGRYRLEERIGLGAHGTVYRATHEFLGTAHAMKLLYGDLCADERVVARLRREARVISAMNHPNVVSITDFGSTKAGLTFLVMEFIEGETLDKLLARSGRLEPRRAIGLATQIAAGLGEAHRLGYVHRDIKPANMMVTDRNGHEHIKLLDFGIAGAARSSEDPRITGSGHFVGTPLYMAPEQAREPDAVGPTSDLYALGVLLFEMLAGHPPFDAPQVVDLVALHAAAPIPPLDAPQELVRLVNRLMHKSPSGRPSSAAAVRDAFEALALPTDDLELQVGSRLSKSPDTLEMELEPYAEDTPMDLIDSMSGASDLGRFDEDESTG